MLATPLIAGNWKMNAGVQDDVALASGLRDAIGEIPNLEVLICPSFVSLLEVARIFEGCPIKIGAQNMHYDDRGPFTGEVSPIVIRDICDYVILGHSERRREFGETDELVNLKVQKALDLNLRPILCVGELLEQRQQGREYAVVSSSLNACLAGIVSPEGLVVAYEPVWAIGTGATATTEEIQVMATLIRHLLSRQFGEMASSVQVIYGGSVTPANIQEIVAIPEVQGALVGASSLKLDEFLEIVRLVRELK